MDNRLFKTRKRSEVQEKRSYYHQGLYCAFLQKFQSILHALSPQSANSAVKHTSVFKYVQLIFIKFYFGYSNPPTGVEDKQR